MVQYVTMEKSSLINKLKAELFNSFFQSQSTLDEPKAPFLDEPICTGTQIDQLIIQPSEVYSVLSSKATDGIGNRILTEASVALSEPLSHLI